MSIVGSTEASFENTKSNEKTATKSDQTKNSSNDTSYANQTDATTNTTVTNGSTNTVQKGGSTVTVGPSTSTVVNSGSVNTSQLLLTPEAVTHMINQILEGTSGLAATTQGQKGAGIYNSTANQLLTDDLLVRTAGEVAAKAAVTRTVIGGSTQTTTNSGYATTNSGSTDVEHIGGTRVDNTLGATQSHGYAGNKSVEDIILTSEGTKQAESSTTGGKVKVGWILCTELYNQGRMPRKYYLYGSREFASYDQQSKKGYYIWAVPALRHLRKHPYSLRSRAMCVLLNARAEYISAERGCTEARKTALGWFAKNLYWGCWILSRTVARNYDFSKVDRVTMEGLVPCQD